MISTCKLEAVHNCLHYAVANVRRGELFRIATNIDYKLVKAKPGQIGQLVLDAIVCGIRCRGYHEYRHVIFTKGE